MDKSFFSSKAHPARRLLDLLAEASIGLDTSTAAGVAALAMVEKVVTRVLDEFETDLALFESAVVDVERFVDDQKRAEEQIVERSARLIEAREREELARMASEFAAVFDTMSSFSRRSDRWRKNTCGAGTKAACRRCRLPGVGIVRTRSPTIYTFSAIFTSLASSSASEYGPTFASMTRPEASSRTVNGSTPMVLPRRRANSSAWAPPVQSG